MKNLIHERFSLPTDEEHRRLNTNLNPNVSTVNVKISRHLPKSYQSVAYICRGFPFQISLVVTIKLKHCWKRLILIDFWCFSATFSNISAIYIATSFSGGRSRSTRKEPPTMGKQLVNFITCVCESNASFCNLQSRARTHTVLVICLYELLGNPTT